MVPSRFSVAVAAVVALVAVTPPAGACPFCASGGQTLSGEVAAADFIVLGTVTASRRDPDDFSKGTTDIAIETVVKPHDYLRGRTVLTIPRFVPVLDKAKDNKYLVFCTLFNRPGDGPAAAVVSAALFANPAFAQVDAYRGEAVRGDSKLADYLKGALEVRGKDVPARLRYFFDYLDSAEISIASDAMMEFGNADYKDVRGVAEKLPADKILGWLRDPNTPASRFGLYGLIAGHCGKPSDAAAIRALLDDPNRQYSSGLDGMIAGYILLDPKAGLEYLTQTATNPKKEFAARYAALKVLRFFWEYRPDVVPNDKVLELMKVLAGQADMADLPIEDLRKWGRWELTEFVLTFADKPDHNRLPIVRRAILRFALSAPAGNKPAAAYVEKMRAADPDRVKFVEQMLADEKPAATPPPPTAGGGK